MNIVADIRNMRKRIAWEGNTSCYGRESNNDPRGADGDTTYRKIDGQYDVSVHSGADY